MKYIVQQVLANKYLSNKTKGSLDNFLFSGSNFLRHSENDRVIQNIFQLLGTINNGGKLKLFSWAT